MIALFVGPRSSSPLIAATRFDVDAVGGTKAERQRESRREQQQEPHEHHPRALGGET